MNLSKTFLFAVACLIFWSPLAARADGCNESGCRDPEDALAMGAQIQGPFEDSAGRLGAISPGAVVTLKYHSSEEDRKHRLDFDVTPLRTNYNDTSVSFGWAGSRPILSFEGFYGDRERRAMPVKIDVTPFNARLEGVGVSHVFQPSSSSELRLYASAMGVQYNMALGGDAQMRLLPFGFSYETSRSKSAGVKASVEASLLTPVWDDRPKGTNPPTIGPSGALENYDLNAAIEGFYELSSNSTVTLGAAIEDTRYTVLKDAEGPNPYFLNRENSGLTLKAGISHVF